MNYANTNLINGVETVVTVLPLSGVPGFDPEHPPQSNTYGVPDDVEVGWTKQPDGSFVAPPSLPLPVPQVVSRYQGYEAMRQQGVLPAVLLWKASASEADQLALDTISEFRRDSQLLARAAADLGLTSEQIDELFFLAATIKA